MEWRLRYSNDAGVYSGLSIVLNAEREDYNVTSSSTIGFKVQYQMNILPYSITVTQIKHDLVIWFILSLVFNPDARRFRKNRAGRILSQSW